MHSYLFFDFYCLGENTSSSEVKRYFIEIYRFILPYHYVLLQQLTAYGDRLANDHNGTFRFE